MPQHRRRHLRSEHRCSARGRLLLKSDNSPPNIGCRQLQSDNSVLKCRCLPSESDTRIRAQRYLPAESENRSSRHKRCAFGSAVRRIALGRPLPLSTGCLSSSCCLSIVIKDWRCPSVDSSFLPTFRGAVCFLIIAHKKFKSHGRFCRRIPPVPVKGGSFGVSDLRSAANQTRKSPKVRASKDGPSTHQWRYP